MNNAKPKAFVPQYLRDNNNSQHTYYHRYRNIRGLWFLERLVRYYRKKQDTWAEDIVQVKHFGKDVRFAGIEFGRGQDFGSLTLFGQDMTEDRFRYVRMSLERLVKPHNGSSVIDSGLLATCAKAHDLHLRLVTQDHYLVFTPTAHYQYPTANIRRGRDLEDA